MDLLNIKNEEIKVDLFKSNKGKFDTLIFAPPGAGMSFMTQSVNGKLNHKPSPELSSLTTAIKRINRA